MEFAKLLQEFTSAVEAGDGTRLGNCFVEEGIYHDTFYGDFKGRDAIRHMLEDKFYKDGDNFLWKMADPVSTGSMGYARWEYFGYTSTMEKSKGRKVILDGMSCFRLRDGLCEYYSEVFNAGVAFGQLGMAGGSMEKVFGKWGREMAERPEMARMLNR